MPERETGATLPPLGKGGSTAEDSGPEDSGPESSGYETSGPENSNPEGFRSKRARPGNSGSGGVIGLFKAGMRGLLREWREERRCLACAAVFRLPEQTQSPAQSPAQSSASKAGQSPETRCGNRDQHAGTEFCPACAVQLQRRETAYCPQCGEPAAWPTLPVVSCARCLAHPPPWDSFAFHGLHNGLLRRMLIRLKFGEQVLLAHALGSLLARHPVLCALEADAVSAVPLHRQRLIRRGYNQALELARVVAAAHALPLLPDLLTRTRNTPPQEGKNRAQRKVNPLGAFAAHPDVRGRRILLFDDVLTTGATLEEAARTLLRAGATAVHVAVVSRTARHFSG